MQLSAYVFKDEQVKKLYVQNTPTTPFSRKTLTDVQEVEEGNKCLRRSDHVVD